jgi:hypothetical protein
MVQTRDNPMELGPGRVQVVGEVNISVAWLLEQ